MRILFLNSIGIRKFGGGEKWCLHAARGLQERGHHVVVAGRRGSEFLRHAVMRGLSVKPLYLMSDFYLWNVFSIGRYLHKEKIDVAIANLNRDVRVVGSAARRSAGTVVLARHGVPLKNKSRYRRMLQNRARGIITNTLSIKQLYRSYNWFDDEFVKVIYNGVENKSSVLPYDYSAEYPGKTVVFSAGRLAEQKGFTYLLKAASIVRKIRDDVVFVIAGKGKLESTLKAETEQLSVEDSVHFIGFTEQIDPYVKGADIFILPSLFEGMPNAVMEAMALGKPVIATDVNGARELIEDGISGIIIPPKDPDVIARTLIDLIGNPERQAALGAAARERVENYFTVPVMIDNLESYLLAKLDAKKNR